MIGSDEGCIRRSTYTLVFEYMRGLDPRADYGSVLDIIWRACGDVTDIDDVRLERAVVTVFK